MSNFPKSHLMRSDHSTWCGRKVPGVSFHTRNRNEADCLTCLKADEAEQRREDAATKPLRDEGDAL